MDDQNHGGPAVKILFDQSGPFTTAALPFGKSKSGKVDEEKRAVTTIKVDTPGFSRCRTGPSQTPYSHEPVDQARFADIGSACHSNLRNHRLRKITLCEGACYELDLSLLHGFYVVAQAFRPCEIPIWNDRQDARTTKTEKAFNTERSGVSHFHERYIWGCRNL